MKFTIPIILLFFLISGKLFSQAYDRHYDPNYVWTTLDENFQSNELNRKVWKPTTRFKRGIGFLIDSTATIKIRKGKLLLKMRRMPNYLDSLWKTTGWQHTYSNYVGAEVNTNKKFGYGVFECRARYAQRRGSWPAFWIIGGSEIPCPPGGHGSEIDIAELAGEIDKPKMIHNIHHYYPPENCDVTLVKTVDSKIYPVARASKYCLYKCIWTPQKIQYFIDNKLKHEVVNKNYSWFPTPYLRLILSQQVLQPFDYYGEKRPRVPQTSRFDWVKVKQFFLAPEITCPQNITAPASATLDVDPRASNITWKLSPASLFSIPEGKGKTGNIARHENTSGPGKITYSFQMPSGETFTAEKEFN